MAQVRMRPSTNMCPLKQSCACHTYECVWYAFNVTDTGSSNTEHTAGQQKQMKQSTIIIFSHLFTLDHRGRAQIHAVECWHAQPAHTPLQPTVAYASADAASSSGTHTHAELLRLPSTSRRRDGARVVVVVGISVVVVLGATGAVVVVVVVVVVVLIVAAVFFLAESSAFVFVWSVDGLLPLFDSVVSLSPFSCAVSATGPGLPEIPDPPGTSFLIGTELVGPGLPAGAATTIGVSGRASSTPETPCVWCLSFFP
ncbi:hypothetical protein TCSYLVIO_008950, partial [Trypanosoma cruzi]